MDPIGALDPLTNLLPDVLKPLGVLWFFWGLFVFWTLINPGDGRTRWLNYINGGLADYYRRNLERLLDYTAKHWFKDKEHIAQLHLSEQQRSFILGTKTFTESSFRFSIRLAIIYPVLSLILLWGFTGYGDQIIGISILTTQNTWWERWLMIIWLAMTFWLFNKSHLIQGWKSWIYTSTSIVAIVSTTFIFSVSVAIAFIGVFTFILVRAEALAISVGFIGSFINAPPSIFIIGFICSVAGAAYTEVLYEKMQPKGLARWFWTSFVILYFSSACGTVYWLSQQDNGYNDSMIWLLFYVLLPLLNVVWDWLSLGVTRSLLYAIADRVHGGWVAFGWALLDGVLALGFLFLITLTVVVGIATTNWVAQLGGGCGASVLDLQLLFDGLRVDALNPDYWWLYFMFLYTLVPTIVHMVIASLSVLLWIPRHKLQEWTKDWKDEQHKFDFPKFALAGGYLAIVAPLAVFMPIALVLILIWLLFTLGGGYTFGTWLLDFLQTVASMIDASVIPSL